MTPILAMTQNRSGRGRFSKKYLTTTKKCGIIEIEDPFRNLGYVIHYREEGT